MHGIPPLHHTTRHTTLNLHHTIIPPIIENRFTIDKLWEDAIEDKEKSGLYMLSLADMILHSATHLFHEGEFENGFRDINDPEALLRQYECEENNWCNLIACAEELDLSYDLFLALRYCLLILNSPVPEELIRTMKKKNKFSTFKTWGLDQCYLRVLSPAHLSCRQAGYSIAS